MRLFDQAGDGLSGLWIDRYGSVALAHSTDLQISESLRSSANTPEYRELFRGLGIETLMLRSHQEQAATTAAAPAELLFGSAPAPFNIEEGGVRYEVDPLRQVNAGLFLDTRELRLLLKDLSHGSRILNLFAFTGSLGTAAFAGGAKEVIQVDISKSVLTWARRNWQINRSLNPNGIVRFFPDDVREFLNREVRRVERGASLADTILLDPPSFGHSAGKAFRVLDDLGPMVERCIALLAPAGRLLVTCNHRSLRAADLEDLVKELSVRADRKITQVTRVLPPKDFTASEADSLAVRGVLLKYEA
jgi:23S rRNA G2069 N7-methylase RlmK/C1962 C5-methylase RlmI